MKCCCTCKIEKDLSEFHVNKTSCKDCRKLERKRSYEKRKETNYKDILEYNKNWAQKNPEKKRQYCRTWESKNRDKARLICNRRYSHAKQARPKWMEEFFISEAYELAQLRSKVTGLNWEVDHIIPIRGELFCGLHVIENMQLLPRSINARKSNRHAHQYKWSEFFKETDVA